MRGIGGELSRALLNAVTILLGIVVVVLLAVVFVSATGWGHERVRRFALSQLNGMVDGHVSIGRVSGDLLSGMVVHDFSIRDRRGAPFVAAQEVRANYGLGPLVSKRIWLSNVRLVRPLIVLDRQPGERWNYQQIFKRDTATSPASNHPGWGSWLKFTNAVVVDGRLVVRTPWEPGENLRPDARDSLIREATGGGSRVFVVSVPGGFQKIVELRSIDATLPLLRLADPAYKDRMAKVASLKMIALPFRPPAAVVRDLKGTFLFNNDSLWWRGVAATLPGSRVSGDGSYELNTGDMALALRAAPAAFADLRWVYPRLPSQGQGTLDFAMLWRGSTQNYLARNADIEIRDASVRGSFGLTLSDTFALHDTDLRFAHVDTRLVEQLMPHFTSPRRGYLSGRAAVNGGKRALTVDADVAFTDVQSGNATSRVAALGEIGFGSFEARHLRLQLRPVQVDLARIVVPTLPIGGMVTGTALLDGSTKSRLTVVADIDHVDRGTRSRVNGKATIRLAGTKWFDVDVTARPVSLVEVGRFAPSVGLQGSATGPIRVTGTLANLRLAADLRLPDGGELAARGTLDLGSREKGYDLAAALHVFNLRTVVARLPSTSLTATVTARGQGLSPATMRSAIGADFATSSWDTVGIDTGSVRVAIANGVAQVGKLELRGSHSSVAAHGSFGLTAGRDGALSYRVAVDSLNAFNRFIPRAPTDTGVVQPRPALVARAIRRARADSLRIATETEVERAATGKPMPPVPGPQLPKPVARDTLAGKLYAAGTVRGNITRFDVRGRASGENVTARGNSARRFRTEYAWTGARTPASTFAVGLSGDSLTALGFAFDSIDARVRYHHPDGHVELVIQQRVGREYALKGNFVVNTDNRELRVATLALRFDSTYWAAPHPSAIRWRANGLVVDNFELRDQISGRIYANGLMPTQGVADFQLRVDNVQVDDILDLLQSDVEIAGVISLAGEMHGTMGSPVFRGAFGLANGAYGGTSVPELRGTFAYSNRQLVTHVDATEPSGRRMATFDGRLPIDLTVTGVTGPRLLDAPLVADLVADSLPLELIPEITTQLSNVHGLAAAKVAVRGTLKRPSLAGSMTLARGTMKLSATGAAMSNMFASIRMLHDTVYVDSVTARARGTIRMTGTIAVGTWRDPSSELYLLARNAEVMNGDHGQLFADAGLVLTGSLAKPALAGQVTIRDGVIRAPEPTGKKVIGAGDPGVFDVVDTTLANGRELFSPPSTMMKNLQMDVGLAVNHNTWVRTHDANIEMYTDYPIQVRVVRGQLALAGTILTDRGEYTFVSKRFQITQGSAQFIGGTALNPSLAVTGEYQVQLGSQPAISVRVLIGGTARHPKISLESDAQPPKSQSDLLSLLAFGRSTGSLLQSEGSSLSSSSAGGNVVGAGAAFAVQRLEGVALGVAVDQLQTEAGRAVGADYFNIMPSDVPQIGGSNNDLSNFFAQTTVEAGKYINPFTFLAVQKGADNIPGARIEHRTAKGWRFSAQFEPVLILGEPSLRPEKLHGVGSWGGFVIHQWRF